MKEQQAVEQRCSRARRLIWLVVLSSLLIVPAPVQVTGAPASEGAPLTVFAASSLTDAFRELGVIFEATSGVPVAFNFGASTQLRTQLEQGAPADLFASADHMQMDRARQAGAIADTDHVFARNRLVVITPASNPAAIQSYGDLANEGVKLVTAQADVPIGVYTQAMFDTMSQDASFGAELKARANANVVSREPNVRQIVAKIQLGEGDAAVVYRSDVTPQALPDLLTFEIPDAFNTLAAYPMAVVAGAAQPEQASMFVSLVLSPEGQRVLRRWNFLPVSSIVSLSPTVAGAPPTVG